MTTISLIKNWDFEEEEELTSFMKFIMQSLKPERLKSQL